MKLRILGIAAKWLFILCLPALLLTASLGWAANSHWLYKYGFEKYDISQTTGLAEAELDEVASGLIGYFNSDEEYITLELFNSKEVAHLKDVKGLIWLDYRVLLGTLVYVLAYAGVCLFWRKKRYWRRLAWAVVGGSSLTLALMLALGLGTLLGFDQLFWKFHTLFFSNDFWLLDPTTDYLIMLFPNGFFYDAALFCALITSGLAIILGGVGGWYLIFSRRRATSA